MAPDLIAPKYGLTLVLGGGLNPDGSLPQWVERRLDSVRDLYMDGATEYIIVNGKGKHETPDITESEAMEQGLLERAISGEHICRDQRSRNTLENFGYSRFDIFDPRSGSDRLSWLPYGSLVGVVISDFQGDRSDGIAD